MFSDSQFCKIEFDFYYILLICSLSNIKVCSFFVLWKQVFKMHLCGKIKAMNDRPMMHLTFRLERPVYYKLLRAVKVSKKSRSKFLRNMVHEQINGSQDKQFLNSKK